MEHLKFILKNKPGETLSVYIKLQMEYFEII